MNRKKLSPNELDKILRRCEDKIIKEQRAREIKELEKEINGLFR